MDTSGALGLCFTELQTHGRGANRRQVELVMWDLPAGLYEGVAICFSVAEQNLFG